MADVDGLWLPLDERPTYHEVLVCVTDKAWQETRLSMKGIPTAEKLRTLRDWLGDGRSWCRQVQVHNYIGALKRGGQITAEGNIGKVV